MDPITGDVILGEQYSALGYPAKFVKIADDRDGTTSTVDYPDTTGVTITTGGTVSTIPFTGTFPAVASAAAGLGHLVWITNAGSNLNAVRKLTSVASGNTFNVNADWPASPTSGHTYRLLIDCFRFNALLIKSEFSVANASCTIRPYFIGVPQDNVLPTPATATPLRWAGQELTIVGTDVSTETTDVSATHYHGEITALGVHGAMGLCFRITSVSSGTVSLWVACV